MQNHVYNFGVAIHTIAESTKTKYDPDKLISFLNKAAITKLPCRITDDYPEIFWEVVTTDDFDAFMREWAASVIEGMNWSKKCRALIWAACRSRATAQSLAERNTTMERVKQAILNGE